MEEFKGTPFPWKWEGNALRGKDRKIVHLEEHTSLLSWQSKANANRLLTESAPDLLEALQELMKVYKEIADSGDCGWWRAEEQDEFIKAQKAINKALGK